MKISFLSICMLLFTSIIISTFKNLYLKSNFLIKYDFLRYNNDFNLLKLYFVDNYKKKIQHFYLQKIITLLNC